MKWFLVLACLVNLQLDSYLVTDIQGRALVLRNNVTIEVTRGRRLYADDVIRFVSENTIIRLAGNKSTFIIRQEADFNNKRVQKNGEFWTVLRNGLLPTQTTGLLRSRNGGITSELEAEAFFKPYASIARPLQVLDTLWVEVDAKSFADTANNFFYLSYKRGGEEINKKIPWKKKSDSLFLSFDRRLLLIDGKENGSIELSDTKLYLYHTKSKQSFFVSGLSIRIYKFLDALPELCILAKAMSLPDDPKRVGKDQIQQFTDYLNTYYGPIDENLFIRKYLSIITSQNCFHE